MHTSKVKSHSISAKLPLSNTNPTSKNDSTSLSFPVWSATEEHAVANKLEIDM